MTTPLALTELRQRLQQFKPLASEKIFVGFDGFVDKIKKAVKTKQSASTVYFDSMVEFGNRIASGAGKSGQIQMDVHRTKLGGNAPILANTLGKLGVSTFCLGSMGYPEIHSVFSEMNSLCTPISVLNPGLSDAIEFADGKFIFSELQVFEKYDWAYIKKTTGLQRIKDAVSSSALIACVDWANLPHASDIWAGLLSDVIKPSGRKNFFFLFDLCDPSKKTVEEVSNVLDLVAQFSPCGQVTLGLNENETLKIWQALNNESLRSTDTSKKIPDVTTAGEYIFKSMNIDTLLVHPIDRCIAFRAKETLQLQGRLVTKPKVLTGGGDNLNAGYCLGLISGLTIPQCLLFGMAASGAYIENGVSPDINGIIRYLNVWIRELQEQNQAKDNAATQQLTN